MTDLELKKQDELVNTMIAHYQAIIDGYKKNIEDAIAEIQAEIDNSDESKFCETCRFCLDIIRKYNLITKKS